MRTFSIPTHYRSDLIGRLKAWRKVQDPRKKDLSPTLLDLGAVRFVFARHFGFCYGVENAIEIGIGKGGAVQPGKGRRVDHARRLQHQLGRLHDDLVGARQR